jgi:hypothetical protein
VLKNARAKGHSITTADQVPSIKHNEKTPVAVRKEVVLDSVLDQLVDPVLPKGTHLFSLVAKYEQGPDDIDGLAESNVLILEKADRGNGEVIILKTDRWAVAQLNDLQLVLTDFHQRTWGVGYR